MKSIKEYKKGMIIKVNDKMQQNYQYELVADVGKDFDEDFNPQLIPEQMLKMGAFEGHYLNDCKEEFPKEWYEHAKDHLSVEKADIDKNFFKVKSRQSLQEWKRKGWIIEPDVRGWFQWYCRYYLGRRLPEVDEQQIKRWRSFVRHRAQVIKNCGGDPNCRKRQRQALLQWAYDPFV